jgi:hypothetical protein
VSARPEFVPLAIPRASLRVPPDHAEHYRAVVARIARHAQGEFIYAGPEAPEVYFLSGRRNPTRSLLEFTEPDAAARPPSVDLLRRRGVTAVVINERPKFSPPLSGSVRSAFEAEYPSSERVGRFTIRWRE